MDLVVGLVWALPISLAATFGISFLIYFPWGTKMVQFPQFSLAILLIYIAICRHYSTWVPPLGNQRIIACLQLPVAYRSLPRPSSPHGA